MSIRDDIAVQTAMATPGASVATMTVLGYTVNDLILLGTAVLLVLQIGYVSYKWYRLARTKECSV